MRKQLIFGWSILLVFCSLSLAADRVVPDAYPTIQAAIHAAAAGDTVTIKPGTYTGVGNRDITFAGKAVTVRSLDGPASTIIDCQSTGRGFIFENNETNASILQGLTIKNGVADFGGAVECFKASPTINHCVFTTNLAEYGGAIDCYQANPVIFNCVFRNNSAHNSNKSGQGGAVACDGSSPTITNALFESNSADQYGTAVDCFNASAPIITNGTFVKNRGLYSYPVAAVYADGLSSATRVNNGILRDNVRDVVGVVLEFSCVQDGTAGTGVIGADPLFRKGPQGDYYLSQVAAGQINDSPALNAGNPAASPASLGLAAMTTRTDNVAETGIVDMGYHYPGGASAVQVPINITIVPDQYGQKNATIVPAEGTALYRRFSEIALTVTPNLGYKVAKWTGTDDDTATTPTNIATVTVAKAISVTLGVHPTFLLTTQVSGGAGTLLPLTARYNSGQEVTLVAAPAAGYRVGPWTITGTDQQYYGQTNVTVTVTGDMTVAVRFVSATLSHLEARVINGHGSITPRRGDYPVGTQVNLEARPDPGFRVLRWTGTDNNASTENTNTVTMDIDKEVTVRFEKEPEFYLQTEVFSPDGIPHGTLQPESGWFDEDEVVNLIATPAAGYEVYRWIGTDDDTSVNTNNTRRMNDDYRVIVEFRLIDTNPNPWQEGEIRINEDPATIYPTIQEAIDAATDGQEVTVSFGTYGGDGNINLELRGKAIAVRGVFGPERTIIDCGGAGRGFFLRNNEGPQSLIVGFTIRGGQAPTGDDVPASGRGGGIMMMADCQASVENCIIVNCRADVGGGICFGGADEIEAVEPSGEPDDPDYDPGDPGVANNPNLIPQASINNCIIRSCSAVTIGGAIYIEEAAPTISSSQIMNCNSTDMGGAIYSLGIADQQIHPWVFNCLIVSNRAGGLGGAFCLDISSPTIQSCTIANNNGAVGPDAVIPRGTGGIVALADTSNPDISGCILSQNGDDLYGCTASDSCIWEGPMNYDIDNGGPGNIFENPRFITGPGLAFPQVDPLNRNYYLSQALGNQPEAQWSACVDAVFAGWPLNGTTTAITDMPDSGLMDMGYHYPVLPPTEVPVRYKFKLYVEPDENGRIEYWTENNTGIGDGIHGIAAPSDVHPVVLFLPVPTLIRLKAIGDSGYRISRWFGTDNDQSVAPGNQVILTRNRQVRATFELRTTRILTVPKVYPLIEDAVAVAKDGDIVVVSPGIHYLMDPRGDGYGIDFEGKEIKLLSIRPDDPAIIASTIIDCQGAKLNPQRAFHFHSGESNDVLIAGFTIRGGWMNGGVGGYAPPYYWPPLPPAGSNFAPPDSIYSGLCGGDKTGDGFGGAILCEDDSSPTIQYCVFSNCTVTGGQGNRGEDGLYLNRQNANHSQPGGHGGVGTGNGYGGAIACVSNSSPIVRYCRFEYNAAHGGSGGDGGNAGDISSVPSPGNASRGGAGGDGYGVGQGGAIYADLNSNPILFQCEFFANYASDALAGLGGARSPSGAEWSNFPASDGATGMTDTLGQTVWGGAAFYNTNSTANFESCSFIDNKAFVLDIFSSSWPLWDNPPSNDIYGLGGAMYIGLNNTVNLTDCVFEGNLGGALYCEGNDILSLQKCQFWKNGTRLHLQVPYDKYFSLYFDYNYYMNYNAALSARYQFNLFDSPPGALNIGPRCPDVQIVDCDFGENFTFGFGGAVLALSDSRFSECRFGGNRSEVSGGALHSDARWLNPGSAVPTLTFEKCSFRENEANEGGAVYLYTTRATFDRCNIFSNQAQKGGGLFLADSWVEILGGMFVANSATLFDAEGGGIAAVETTMTIRDCLFENNRIEGQNSFGGAVSILGGDSVFRRQRMVNCLFTGNYAEQSGGALSIRMMTAAELENCTFASNTAGGRGGAIFGDWCSSPTVGNSIFSGNAPQAIYEEWINFSPLPRGDSVVTYSLFFDNAADLYDSQTRRTYTGAALINALGNNHDNLDGDPLFTAGPLGPFYLGSVSPAVDRGGVSALQAGLDARTTQATNAPDTDVVDLGYHYLSMANVPTVTLTASVVGGHGQVTPTSGTYYQGQAVVLTAKPNTGFQVDHWGGGTVNDFSGSLTNVVMMDTGKNVTVRFKQPRVLVVGSAPRYTDIQGAIDAAKDGDVVMIMPGQYLPPHSLDSLTFMGKNITLTGSNPDQPGVVEATVLRDYDLLIVGAGKKSVIEGITFQASTLSLEFSNLTIRNCRFIDAQWVGGDGEDGNQSDGYNGSSISGGAIQMYFSSPQLLNCRFENCSLTGGNGGRGANFSGSHADGWDGGWGGWAHGGAVYLGYMSNPIFDSCSFIDCFVQGGRGGDGGNGDAGNGGYGGRGGSWTWAETLEYYWFYWWEGWERGTRFYNNPYVLVYPTVYGSDMMGYQRLGGPSVAINMQNRYPWERFAKWFGFEEYISWDDWIWNYTYDAFLPAYDDYWRYSGLGGAVYCELDSNPVFRNCFFQNCRTYGGISGIGGGGANDPTRWPERNLLVDNGGGAIFATRGCKVTLIDTTLKENIADPSTAIDLDGDPATPPDELNDDFYVSFGGGIGYTNECVMKAVNSNFMSNEAAIGGGFYFDDSSVDVADCNFIENLAYHGGGIYSSYSMGQIDNTFFRGNLASMSPATNSETGIAPAIPALPNSVLYGHGAGLFSLSSDLNVRDSVFTGNTARGNGGGIYYLGSGDDVMITPELFNSLLYQNAANLGGGGVAAMYFARPYIANCTIAENRGGAGSGGGLFVSYNSDVDVVNSILWDNGALNGAQLAVGSGDEFGPRISTVRVTYSDIGPEYDPNAILDVDQGPIIPPSPPITIQAQLIDPATIQQNMTAGNGRVDVIVTLRQPVEIRKSMNWKNSVQVQLYRDEVADRITAVLNTLQTTDYTVKHRYENFAAFSARVNQAALDSLLANGMVTSIEPVRPVYPMLRQAIQLASAERARQMYDGTGTAVAIVDSGVDYRHPMLGGGGFPNDKVIGGYDTAMNDADPLPVDEAHGTCCAGIAAGTLGEVGDYVGGVAYNAKIYALKIGADDGSMATAAALAAWDWCITHQYDNPDNPILVMSNSWGIYSLPFDSSAVADAFAPAFTQAAALAVERGITVLASSGNDGFAGQGISWPSAISHVISVGAVYDTTDQVTDYSNSHDLLDILAPADPVYTTDIIGAAGYDPGDYFPTFAGTSSSCPFAAGCVASIQRAAMMQIRRFLIPEEIRGILINTGDPVTDTKVAVTKPRVNLGAAVANMISKPIYVEAGCILEGWNDEEQTWDADTFNLGVDPLFLGRAEGNYFLSEIAAGQLEDSPCLNAGSDLASVFGLDLYTTRSDSVVDDGVTNLGYHHRLFEPKWVRLFTNVFGSTDVAGYIPTITPHDPEGIVVKWYTQFALKIEPTVPYGYGVIWTGTDDDLLTTPENVVTVNRDKVVLAEITQIFFHLQTEFYVDPAIPASSTATITPPSGLFEPLTMVTLHVTPPPTGFQVRWYGTDKDTRVGPMNYVTMKQDTKVTAWYEPIETKYYGIVIGVGDYPDIVPDLPYAESDAAQFFSKLVQMPQWKSENIRLLLGRDATLAAAQRAYVELRQRMDPDDVFVFYFAGHGTTIPDAFPIDEFDGLDEALVLGDLSLLTDDQVAKWINGLPTQHYSVFIDAGFRSGSITQEFVPRGLGVDSPKRGDDFGIDLVPHNTVLPDGTIFTADPNGLGVVISATLGDQSAWEYPELQHGLFTYQLIKAIDGAADWYGDRNGWVSGEECFAYVLTNVSAWMEDWDDLGLLPVTVKQKALQYDAKSDLQIEFIPAPAISSGIPKTYYVPGTFTSIQETIQMARDGDLIVLAANTYQGGGLVIDKNITITSANPDDPDVVAATIIDCSGTLKRGVYFTRNAGPGAVLNGITIRNGVWTALPPDPGVYDGRHIAGGGILVGYQSSPTIKNCVISGFRITGGNAVGSPNADGDDGGFSMGAGIYCAQESSPTIINCTITDCHVVGGNATGGVSASAGDPSANPPVAAQPIAGRGGWGGGARGGGVYIAPLSRPVFRHCTISDCTSTGGNGGDGGNFARINGIDVPGGYGGLWSDSSYAPWQAWGYIGDYRYYSGSGAGVYCEIESEPKFIECLIQGNQARGGMSGLGGTMPAGYDRQQPMTRYEVPAYGGGVFCGENAKAEFTKCRFFSNVAPKPSTNYTVNAYLGHGGGIAFERSASIALTNCSFRENDASVGAGIYYLDDMPMIADCNFIENDAIYGGGIFADGGAGVIDNCEFLQNLAGALIGGGSGGDPNGGGGGAVTTNVFGQGGAIYSVGSGVQIRNSRMINNVASTSGGGAFFSGTIADGMAYPTMTNCLLARNIAGRDGGGVSANWYTNLSMSNCTLTENNANGLFGQLPDDGYGGAMYCGYYSDVSIDYSIVWSNQAAFGRNLVVGTGFEFDPRPGRMTVSQTFMSDGWSAEYALVEEGCVLDKDGRGNIDSGVSNPLFVTGRYGSYYLSQIAAGQTQQSICVDAGDKSASALGMNKFTTRTDGGLDIFDAGNVDLGYHYPLIRGVSECRYSDIGLSYIAPKGLAGRDGRINIADLAVLSSEWLRICMAPNWCSGADINRSGSVELSDLVRFTDCWFEKDQVIPIPNPSEWGIRHEGLPGAIVEIDGKPQPVPNTLNQLIMTAKPTLDNWGWDIAYRFEGFKTNDPSNVEVSPWLYFPQGVDPTWIATGLSAETSYTFVVRAAEIRVPGTLQEAGYAVNPSGATTINASDVSQGAPLFSNWTEPSVTASAKTGHESDPPILAEIAWLVQPYQSAAAAVSMEAAAATDVSGPVTYHFRRYSPPDAATYTEFERLSPADQLRTFTDTSVVVGQTYAYSFVAKDRHGNTSVESPRVTVAVMVIDLNPPVFDGDPIIYWEIAPVRSQVINLWYDFMQTAIAVDPEGTVVEYQVRDIDSGYVSPWRTAAATFTGPDGEVYPGNAFWRLVGQFQGARYQVRARDTSPRQNTTAWSPAVTPQ